MHILADMTPLMTFFIELNNIDPLEFFFQILEEKIFGPLFPNFDL